MNKPRKKNKHKLTIRPENPRAKALMWISVILFTCVITILWAWSAKIQLSGVDLSISQESEILRNTQAQWEKIFAENDVTLPSSPTSSAITAPTSSAIELIELEKSLRDLFGKMNSTTTASTTTNFGSLTKITSTTTTNTLKASTSSQ
ncbi:MAG: hypothetical protein ABH832_00760 [bacterium]